MPENKPPRAVLSKSTFIRGVQCEKSLYLHKKRPFLRDKITARQLAIFSRGTKVGVFARQLFPGGVDASPKSHFQMAASAEKTLEYIASGESIIYEAAFQHNGVIIALDILVKDQQGWKAVEVKSSRGISDTYIWDAALQYHVIAGNGILLKDFSIAYIDEHYVKDDILDPLRLFRQQSVLDRIQQMQESVAEKITRFQEVINLKSSPLIPLGLQCTNPYACDFTGHCWKKIPDGSVFQLRGLSDEKKFGFYTQGIVQARAIPVHEMDQRLMRQVQAITGDTIMADQDRIREYLARVKEPPVFLSILWGQPAMPSFKGMRPYQRQPFSMVVDYPAETKRENFLMVIPPDEAMQVAHLEMLLAALEGSSSILVFNASSHIEVLRVASRGIPHLEEAVDALWPRMTDLQSPFQDDTVVWPRMNNWQMPEDILYSMKKEVTSHETKPASLLEASLLYQQLIVNEGAMGKSEGIQAIGRYHQGAMLPLKKLWQVLKELSQ